MKTRSLKSKHLYIFLWQAKMSFIKMAHGETEVIILAVYIIYNPLPQSRLAAPQKREFKVCEPLLDGINTYSK